MITIALLIALIILAISIIVQNGIISGKLIDKKEIVTYINANFPKLSWYKDNHEKLDKLIISQGEFLELSLQEHNETRDAIRTAKSNILKLIYKTDSMNNNISSLISDLGKISYQIEQEGVNNTSKLLNLSKSIRKAIGNYKSVVVSLRQLIENNCHSELIKIKLHTRVWDYFHGEGTIVEIKRNKTFIVLFDSGHKQLFNEIFTPISDIGFRTLFRDVVRDLDSDIDNQEESTSTPSDETSQN